MRRPRKIYDDPVYQANRRQIILEVERRWNFSIPVSCWICGQAIAKNSRVSIEHIKPVRDGGTNNLYNLAPAHPDCNSAMRPRAKLRYRRPDF